MVRLAQLVRIKIPRSHVNSIVNLDNTVSNTTVVDATTSSSSLKSSSHVVVPHYQSLLAG